MTYLANFYFKLNKHLTTKKTTLFKDVCFDFEKPNPISGRTTSSTVFVDLMPY